MTSFPAIESYSSILVFLVGFLTYIGFMGTGFSLLRILRIVYPSPWNWVVAVLLGIQTGSLLVQFAGMTGVASQWLLISIWIFMLAAGIFFLVSVHPDQSHFSLELPQGSTLVIAIPVLVALLINLVAAIAPSTKIDELYYHMLLPARIVHDQALVFYRLPLESAALPQMIYQISLTPLHAIGFPDSGNVISLGLNLTFIGFGWDLIRRYGGTKTWAWLCIAPLCIGMYPVIWHVTGGAFAMGDLATSSAILALFLRKELLKKMPAKQYFLLFSMFVLGSVSSKITLLPLGIFMIFINVFLLFRSSSTGNERIKIFCIMALPWFIFYFPILFWTWRESGSPFGSFLTGMWGVPSVYSIDPVQDMLKQMREENIPTIPGAIKASCIDYTPLLWLCVILIFTEKIIPFTQKLLILLLMIIQSAVVLGLLYFELRFFGGLIQGLALFFAIMASGMTQNKIVGHKIKIVALTFFFILPWLTIQIYYSTQFMGVVTGYQEKAAFYSQKTSFYEDYKKINHLIPKDGVILFHGTVRLSSVYSPRAVYFTETDIPPGKEVFLMIADGKLNPGDSFGRYRVGEQVYENNQAITDVYRTPGKPPRIRNLKVYRLETYYPTR